MQPDKKGWFKDAKLRLVGTVLAAVSAIIAAGVIFDWRAALGIFAVEVLACIIYSLRKLWKKKKEARS